MNTLKIGIVEDDLIIAQSISEMLTESGYAVTPPAKRYSEAIRMIEEEAPDLLLLDVAILGRLDGIEVGRTVQKVFHIPFIFLTANTDHDTISRAKEVAPAAFLAKPITKQQLYAAIEIAMANALQGAHLPGKAAPESRAPQAFYVKDGYNYRKVDPSEIIYAESEQNYVTLQLEDGSRVTMRSTMTEFSERLDPGRFLRVHRSFVVAANHVKWIEGNTLVAGRHSVPIGKNYREDVLRTLGVRR